MLILIIINFNVVTLSITFVCILHKYFISRVTERYCYNLVETVIQKGSGMFKDAGHSIPVS